MSCDKEEVSWLEMIQTSKPWTRWWWMDCAVDSTNILREQKEFAGVGIGGVEITPIYGVKGEDDRVLEFFSPEFPVAKYIPVETMTQLIDFQKNGVKVYFDDQLPQSVPG